MKALSSLLLTLGFSFVAVYYFPHEMVSPGELHRSHSKKIDSCMKCHTVFQGIPDTQCTACHKEADLVNSKVNSKVSAERNSEKRSHLIHPKKWLQEKTCLNCHDEHMGANARLLESELDSEFFHKEVKGNCETCHSPPGNLIHKQVEHTCNTCHNSESWKKLIENAQSAFHKKEANCKSCHENPSDNLHEQMSGNCNTCHTFDDWKKLKQNAKANFHKKGSDCTSCHKKPADNIHRQSKGNCSTCHTFKNWKSSFVNHTKYFKLGKKHNKGCNKCHISGNYKSYTCYSCHEHSKRKIRKEHHEHKIRKYNNCVACHRSGSEKKAKAAWKRIKKAGNAGLYR